MRLRYLRGDMQPKAKALPARSYITSKKGFEESFHCQSRYRFASVGNRKSEYTPCCFRFNPDGMVGGPMRERIADQIRC